MNNWLKNHIPQRWKGVVYVELQAHLEDWSYAVKKTICWDCFLFSEGYLPKHYPNLGECWVKTDTRNRFKTIFSMQRRDYTVMREAIERWLADKFFHPGLFDDQPRNGCVHSALLGSTIQTPPNLTRLYAGWERIIIYDIQGTWIA